MFEIFLTMGGISLAFILMMFLVFKATSSMGPRKRYATLGVAIGATLSVFYILGGLNPAGAGNGPSSAVLLIFLIVPVVGYLVGMLTEK